MDHFVYLFFLFFGNEKGKWMKDNREHLLMATKEKENYQKLSCTIWLMMMSRTVTTTTKKIFDYNNHPG